MFRWKQENKLHQCQQIIQHLLLHGIHRNFYLPTHVMTRINITKSEMPVLSNYLVLLKNKKTTATFKKFLFYSQDINSRISSRLRSLGPLSKCKRSSSNSSIVNGSSPELFCQANTGLSTVRGHLDGPSPSDQLISRFIF